MKREGIQTVELLASSPVEQIAGAMKASLAEARSIRIRAQAMLRQQIVQEMSLELPPDRAYVDIETDLNSKYIWLVGVHIESENKTYSFFASTPKHEKRVLTDLLEFIDRKQGLNLISYSGCGIEQRMITKRLTAHELPTGIGKSIRDIYYDIHKSVGFPTQGLTLKDVANHCGFKWRDPDTDGFYAASLYGRGKMSKAKKKKLIRYNEDDLLALKRVVQSLDVHVASPTLFPFAPSAG